jgi:hypothetical protein
VVTDVKDFSDLTRQYPELMNKAMGIHNNILRKASHNHAGYIMDQEVRWGGDSCKGWGKYGSFQRLLESKDCAQRCTRPK